MHQMQSSCFYNNHPEVTQHVNVSNQSCRQHKAHNLEQDSDISPQGKTISTCQATILVQTLYGIRMLFSK